MGRTSLIATAYWSFPLPGGSPRRLGDFTAGSASWGRDGKLVFAKGSELYLAERDGGNPHKIATASDFVSKPRFSPDSKRIRFTVENRTNNTATMWEVQVDVTGMHQFPALMNNAG